MSSISAISTGAAYAPASFRSVASTGGTACPTCGQTSCDCGTGNAAASPGAAKGGGGANFNFGGIKTNFVATQTGQQLSEEEEAKLAELKARDIEVRAHERAHASVGGGYAGAPHYDYEIGPDGKRYAVGGEVSIDIAAVPNNPQATIAKMEVVRAAALAPADPSAQDKSVAAAAAKKLQEAEAELRKLEDEGKRPDGSVDFLAEIRKGQRPDTTDPAVNAAQASDAQTEPGGNTSAPPPRIPLNLLV